MKPGLCFKTFLDEDDGLTHHCFQPIDGHPPRHYCICLDRGRAFAEYGPRYYDRQGNRIPMCAWAVLFEDKDGYCRIASTDVGPWWVSTMWLGLDHSFGRALGRDDGPPIIFETMVFWHGPEGSEPDNDRFQERYSTEEEALRGHAEAVAQCQRSLKALPAFPLPNGTRL